MTALLVVGVLIVLAQLALATHAYRVGVHLRRLTDLVNGQTVALTALATAVVASLGSIDRAVIKVVTALETPRQDAPVTVRGTKH